MNNNNYVVRVDDNFHFMDESERIDAGEYETYQEAEERGKEIVERNLQECLMENKTAQELLSTYKMYGEDPFIDGLLGASLPTRTFLAWWRRKKKSDASGVLRLNTLTPV